MFFNRLNVKYQCILFLMLLFFCANYSYSQEIEIGDYSLTYTVPNNAVSVEHNQPNVVGVWEMPDSGDVFLIYANILPNKLDIIESGIIEGIEEEIGAKIQSFTDFQTDHLLFREGTADIPGLDGFKFYLSYWWKDGIFIKLQGRFKETKTDTSIASFRSILSGINVLSQGNIGTENEKREGNIDLHEISKKIGGISFLILIALVVYISSKKRKIKSKQNNL